MTTSQQNTIADQMIGAAQKLEKAAKRLKEEAKLFRSGTSSASGCDPSLWLMHKQNDVRCAAESAHSELLEAL